MPINRDDIVNTARQWIGVKWQHQGRSKAGIDCIGLIVVVARELGIADTDEFGYSRDPKGHALVSRFANEMDSIPLSAILPGDVLLFADSMYPCHCAFVTKRNESLYILHAHATRRKVLEEHYSFEWLKKIRKAYRFKGLI